tara:strand:+ start:28756 stop:29100 length:345 start_codon:yes stop_codon:yes gene_type:complete
MGGIADVSIGLSTEAHKCDMADMDGPCEHDSHPKGCNMDPVDCCSDDFVQIQFNESFNSSKAVQTELNTDFVVAFTIVYLNLYNFQSASYSDYMDYSPPLLQQDISVLFQSFLI